MLCNLDNIKMSDYDFNCTACLDCIKKIIIDFPRGMTPKMLKSILKIINFSQELLNDMVCQLINHMNRSVDYMWNKYEIPSKMVHLKHLSESSPPEIAWRPKTGEVNSNSLIAEALLERKALLEKQISIVRAQSEDINKYIEEHHEKLQQQLDLMKRNSMEDIDTKDFL